MQWWIQGFIPKEPLIKGVCSKIIQNKCVFPLGGMAACGAGRGAQHQGPALLNSASRLRPQFQVQVGAVGNAPAGTPSLPPPPQCLIFALVFVWCIIMVYHHGKCTMNEAPVL